MEKIEYDGKWCVYKRIENITRHWDDPVRFCPLCKQQISKGDTIYLFINNYILFPNISCHAECIHDKVTPDTIEKLIYSFQSFLRVYSQAKAWFHSATTRSLMNDDA